MSSDGNPREDFRVLVVDDDQDTADSAADILKYLGYQGMAAYDAANAHKLARLLTPQVVILDLAMPDGDGLQLARSLRTLPRMEEALLICVSGYGTEEDKRLVREAGCAHHFIKPVDWQELTPVLEAFRTSAPHLRIP